MYEENYRMLANAVYESATSSLVDAIVSKNVTKIQSEEKFLTSGAYCISPDVGQYIVNKVKEEVKLSTRILDEFLESGKHKKIMSRDVCVVKIMKVVARQLKYNEVAVREVDRKPELFKLVRVKSKKKEKEKEKK